MKNDMKSSDTPRAGHAAEVLAVFLKLGLTCFGGPIAHLGYFHREFVEKRRWLDSRTYTDLIGLCQFLPGPASSQAGFSIGLLRAGWAGGLAAWIGFTLPSVLLMLVFAALAPDLGGRAGTAVVHGLKLVAVAVVAQAVWDMARRLCPDKRRTAIALAAMAIDGVVSNRYAQLMVICVGALLGLALCRNVALDNTPADPPHLLESRISKRAGAAALIVFCVLLSGLPLAGTHAAAMFDGFYRSGALVFGGGHVVLPLLQQQTVATGWVAPNDFLAGYGAAQAMPGPLFTFAAYLGWIAHPEPHRWAGAALATFAIFLPGLLLVIAALPYWGALRRRPRMAAAMAGVSAAVVGLLAGALYTPVFTSAMLAPADFFVAATGLLLLTRWKLPPLVVVAWCVVASVGMTALA